MESKSGKRERIRRGPWISLILFFSTLYIYTINLCPSLWWMDSGEFVFHSTVLGIPHPTGYPLYIQLGKLLTILPGVEGEFALNLFSAVMASMTVVLLYRIIFTLEGENFVAVISALLFAFSFTFWSQAEIAEVYTFHTFFLSVMVLLLLRMRRDNDRRVFLLLSFILGLSLTHHMSTVLMFPALVYFVILHRRREVFCLRTLVPAFILFVLGVSVYLFIPLRSHLQAPFNYPELHGVNPGNIRGFLWFVTGRIVKADMFQYAWNELDKSITFYIVKLMRDFLYVGFIVGFFGALNQYKRERCTFYTFLLAFLAYFVFFVDYGVADQHVFFIPSFLFWSIWIGAGLSSLARRIRSVSGIWGAALHWGFVGGLIFLFALAFDKGFNQLNFRNNRGPSEFAKEVLGRVEENALISSIYEVTPLLWYYHFVEGMNPGVEVVDRGLMSLNVRQEVMDNNFELRSPIFENQVDRIFKKRLEDSITREISSRPCYLVKYDPFLCDRFFLEEVGRGLYKIVAKNPPGYYQGTVPDVAFSGSFRYNEKLDLYGVDISDKELVEGDLFRIRIFWSAARLLKDAYRVLFRFKQNRELESYELEENSFMGIFTLGGGMFRDEELVPGMVVVDSFDCFVPPDTRGGEYLLSLAFVEEERFYSVSREDLVLDYHDLGTVRIRENPDIVHYWD